MSDGGEDRIGAFVGDARRSTGEAIERFEAFAFGNSPRMADELAALVFAGRKRATASLLAEYRAEGEPLPDVGAFGVVLDGAGRPVALIRTRAVTVVAFRDVDEVFAWEEGEGDRSLRFWRDAHRAFFARSDPSFSEDSPIVCERFEVVYPRAAGETGEATGGIGG